ncbi:hypothetical protein AA0113_g10843 [Alternaria arborescens]|uniref:Mannan endo-1,6-alpha-mannosidase n=1 Tax=Alternaria arborescens TaxID=156630 RepID=A0A4Q4QJX2_9PLEO|nr:hypothetical protein AA0112_g753 [Alternaria arborescens]RYO43579.1 hypothetical protein AA0113_g10843 [Alternaria arborescens]
MRIPRVASFWRLCVSVSLLTSAFATSSIASSTGSPASQEAEQPVYEPENQNVASSSTSPSTASYTVAEANVLQDLHSALSTMQDQYFSVWLGKYTTAIDWTAAVMSTYVSATLSSLSRSLSYTMPGTFDKSRKLDVEAQMVENEINRYFAQTTAYYFGEDAFAIRMQAFDDMLWVVLGWLEATTFIESHSVGHYTSDNIGGKKWHANQFVPAFAHRARVFYELAEKGWDWRLCGGGMTWNPRLLPYKNAITNQLFISASINMYLQFPGDDNCSPFLLQHDEPELRKTQLYDDCDDAHRGRYDPVYLANAINAYEWLKNVGMTNDQGLYVDGFHIGGYRTNHSKTTCDERNEMVYTYNQGVLLSGLRGLWEASGNISYLEDGHELVRNVIRATGWTRSGSRSPSSSSTNSQQRQSKVSENKEEALPTDWAGLGYNGVLTELCDPSGRCSQDGQTFKGIFFHHLTSFCNPLPSRPTRPGKTHAATRETAMLHANSCREYTTWVTHNAQAALQTRDEAGRFGSWWGAPQTPFPFSSHHRKATASDGRPSLPQNATDYRNMHTQPDDGMYMEGEFQEPSEWSIFNEDVENEITRRSGGDLNDRGRGRTIETQGSGLAVVRAMWEFLRRAEGAETFPV